MIRYKRNDLTDTPALQSSGKSPAVKLSVTESTTEAVTRAAPTHPEANSLPEADMLDLMAITSSSPKSSKPVKQRKARGGPKVSGRESTLPLLADIKG